MTTPTTVVGLEQIDRLLRAPAWAGCAAYGVAVLIDAVDAGLLTAMPTR